MIDLHPEFLKKNGKNEFVVLPYEEFVRVQELLEDVEDILALREAKAEDGGKASVSLADLKRKFNVDG